MILTNRESIEELKSSIVECYNNEYYYNYGSIIVSDEYCVLMKFIEEDDSRISIVCITEYGELVDKNDICSFEPMSSEVSCVLYEDYYDDLMDKLPVLYDIMWERMNKVMEYNIKYGKCQPSLPFDVNGIRLAF